MDEYDDTGLTNDEDFDIEDEEIIEEEEEEEEEDDEPGVEISPEEAITIKELTDFQTRNETLENIYTKLYETPTLKTIPKLTKYEIARIIGERATQISRGAPTLIDVGDMRNPIDIAKKELDQGKLPYLVRRIKPGKNLRKPNFEVIRLNTLPH